MLTGYWSGFKNLENITFIFQKGPLVIGSLPHSQFIRNVSIRQEAQRNLEVFEDTGNYYNYLSKISVG